MTTGYKKGNVDIDTLLEPRTTGDPQAPATGFKVDGVDISTMFYPLASGGTAPTSTIGISVAGDDLNTIFAAIGTVSTTGSGIFTAYWYDSAGSMYVDGVLVPYNSVTDIPVSGTIDVEAGAEGGGVVDVYDFSSGTLVGSVIWANHRYEIITFDVVDGHYYGNNNAIVTVMNELGTGNNINAFPTIPTIANESYTAASYLNTLSFGAGHYIWANVAFDIMNDSGEIRHASTQAPSGKHYVKTTINDVSVLNTAVLKYSILSDYFSYGTLGELDPIYSADGYNLNGSSFSVTRNPITERLELIATGSSIAASYAAMLVSPGLGNLGSKAIRLNYTTEMISGSIAQFSLIAYDSLGNSITSTNFTLPSASIHIILPANTVSFSFFVGVGNNDSAKLTIDNFILY